MKISVVVPVYRGGLAIAELLERLFKATAEYTLQVIFVCDGCDKLSHQTVREIADNYPETVDYINLENNHGQQAAILKGLSIAAGDYVVTIDDDLQHYPEHIPRLISRLTATNSEVVYARFHHINSPFTRRMGSNFARSLNRLVFKNLYHCYSPYRLITSRVAQKLVGFDVDKTIIDLAIPSLTGRITHIDCEHDQRKNGKSGYTTWKLISLWFMAYQNRHYSRTV